MESFGLDEAWIDLSNPGLTIRDGERIAHEIRLRVKRELGITVSVGVSFNKIFAKLGSDMKKPDAVTVISQDSFRDMVWPLPVGDLLFVGPATRRRLADMNVRTIGDLARFEAECLRSRLGKPGLMLKAYAAGLDRSPVMPADERMAIQSIGNSTTPPHDLETMADARCLYYLLAESVAARLRQEGLRARCVSISARNAELVTRSCQQTLPRATSLTGEIAQAAMRLFDRRFAQGFPYRSVGLSCSALTPDDAPVQLDFSGRRGAAHQNRAAGKRHRRAAPPLRASDRAPGGGAHRRTIRADQPQGRAYGASRAVLRGVRRKRRHGGKGPKAGKPVQTLCESPG